MDLNNYLAYVVIAIITITSPGAAILLAISNGMRYNLKAVVLGTLANALGLFILSSIAFLGVGAVLKTFSFMFIILKIAGALYLIYLGIKLILKKELKLNINNEVEQEDINYLKVAKTAFLVAITNPKPILFFTAVFPLFMSPHYSLLGQFFIMTGTFLSISIVSLITYGYVANRFKNYFSSAKSLNLFNKITGSLFILMGLAMGLYSRKAN